MLRIFISFCFSAELITSSFLLNARNFSTLYALSLISSIVVVLPCVDMLYASFSSSMSRFKVDRIWICLLKHTPKFTVLKKSDMILIGMLNTNTANNKFYIQTKTLKSLSPFRVLFLICHFAFNKFAYTFSNQINQNNRNKEKC